MNDHFIVSRELHNGSILSNHKILEDGHNPSDHLPITMKLSMQIDLTQNQAMPDDDEIPSNIKWDKLDQRSIDAYSNRLKDLLSMVDPPSNNVCNDSHCSSNACCSSIQSDYDQLIHCVRLADSLLPRHTPSLNRNGK